MSRIGMLDAYRRVARRSETPRRSLVVAGPLVEEVKRGGEDELGVLDWGQVELEHVSALWDSWGIWKGIRRQMKSLARKSSSGYKMSERKTFSSRAQCFLWSEYRKYTHKQWCDELSYTDLLLNRCYSPEGAPLSEMNNKDEWSDCTAALTLSPSLYHVTLARLIQLSNNVNISLAKCCSTHLMDISSSTSSMENIKHGTVKCLPRAWPKNLTLESYTIEVQILSPALPPQPERQTLGRTSRSIIDIWKCL